MKSRMLFILSREGTGGIISSFLSLYNELKDHIEVKVLFASSNRTTKHPFSKDLITDVLLTSYTLPISSLPFKQKIVSLVLQPYKQIVMRNGNGRFPRLLGKWVAHRLMRKYHFDVVIGFSEGLPTRLASCFDGIKTVSWIHCDYQRYYDIVCKRKDELDIYNHIDTIVCVSNFTRNSFLRIYPSLSDKTQYIYNLLDTARIKELSSISIEDKRFITEKFTIISVGRVDPVKRFSSIPQIAKELEVSGVKFCWYIIGPECNEVEISLLKNRITQYGVEKTVVWLGGKNNPYPYMLNSDVYVCLSSSEACPMVFNEAKILGLPIITTNFGSAYEFLQDGTTGLISSIESISSSIYRLYKDKDLYAIIKNNIKTFSFDNKEIVKEIKSILNLKESSH